MLGSFVKRKSIPVLGFDISSTTVKLLELSYNGDRYREASGLSEIVSQPKVITGDKENAIIKSGTEVPYQEASANGETIVLSGVFRSEDVESTDKVPFFGDLPYVGALFSRNSLSKNKNELLIFITPRILADTLID